MLSYSIPSYYLGIGETTFNLKFVRLCCYNLQKSNYEWHELSEPEFSDQV